MFHGPLRGATNPSSKMIFDTTTFKAELLQITPIDEVHTQGVHFLFSFGDGYGASVVNKCKVEGQFGGFTTYGGDHQEFEIAHIRFTEGVPVRWESETFNYKLTDGIDVVGFKRFEEVPLVLDLMQRRNFKDFSALGSSDSVTDLTLRDDILSQVHRYAWGDPNDKHDLEDSTHMDPKDEKTLIGGTDDAGVATPKDWLKS